MRSRFNHEGALDHHAENEHELFRRADEALERQRQFDHAARASEHTVLGASILQPRNSFASPIGTANTGISGAMPRMPHDEIAERLAVKSTPLATAQAALSWPPRPSAPAIGQTHAFRSKR